MSKDKSGNIKKVKYLVILSCLFVILLFSTVNAEDKVYIISGEIENETLILDPFFYL